MLWTFSPSVRSIKPYFDEINNKSVLSLYSTYIFDKFRKCWKIKSYFCLKRAFKIIFNFKNRFWRCFICVKIVYKLGFLHLYDRFLKRGVCASYWYHLLLRKSIYWVLNWFKKRACLISYVAEGGYFPTSADDELSPTGKTHYTFL